jgi:hypothetical protein
MSLLYLSSCSTDNEQSTTQLNEFQQLQGLAKQKGLTLEEVSLNDKNIYWVSSVNELRNTWQSMESDLKIKKVKNFSPFPITNKEELEDILNEFLKTKTNDKNIKKHSITSRGLDEDPPYTYSVTTYFDNRYPTPNVYVTINYNVNSQGYINSAEVISGSYGYSMGGYTQLYYVSKIQDGILVFEMTGQLTSSVGLSILGSGFSANGANNITFTGVFQVRNGGSGGGSGFVTERNSDTNPGGGYVPPIVN